MSKTICIHCGGHGMCEKEYVWITTKEKTFFSPAERKQKQKSCFNCLKDSGANTNQNIVVVCSICKGTGRMER